jgi:hypothetical protein
MKMTFVLSSSSDLEMDLIKKQMLAKAQRVLFLSMVKMESLAKDYAPFNTGLLSISIHLIPSFEGVNEYILSDGVNYGEYVEYDTKPHIPPIDPLKDWALLKLGDENIAYAIRAKIAKKGVKKQPFFRPALHEVNTIWFPQYKSQVFAA